MKIIRRGQDARDSLKRGIDLVADAVKDTLGPGGRNAVIGRLGITPIVTNDGAFIARSIEAEDEIENEGVWMVKEATAIADSKSGDGTTTTATLLQAIVSELFERMKDDGTLQKRKVNAIALSKELDTWCQTVVEKLREIARPITNEDIYNVALVSAEYTWLAEMIAEIYKQIGKDGFITIEEGVKTKYEVFKGIEIAAGYPNEYYINNDKRECVLENPYILVTNQALEQGVIASLVEIIETGKLSSLIIVAPDFSKDLIQRLVTTKVKGGLTIVPVKLPTFDKNDVLVDITTFAKAKFLDKALYAKYEDLLADVKLENFGQLDKAILGDVSSMLIGGEGDTSARVTEIQKLYDESESEFDKQKLEKRIAYLSGGIALVTIGGDSEFERSYFKLKAEDTVNAVQGALKEGVVKGGGLALKEISEELTTNILSNALQAPYKQIQLNNGELLDIPDIVIDPVRTTVSALKTACSLAGKIITTETVISHKREKPKSNHDES